MALTIGSNIASLQAQRRLFDTSERLATVFERLASGQRINRASDDAAGLAISESLRSDRKVFEQGIRNLNDGISLLNIADGAVSELSGVVTRLQELAAQSANGILGAEQRAALDEEAQALSAEFSRISRSSEFNGIKLFDGSLNGLRIQAGYGENGGVLSSLGGAIGTGGFQSGAVVAAEENLTVDIDLADLNGDGYLDAITLGTDDSNNPQVTVQYGNGSGGFSSSSSVDLQLGAGTPRSLSLTDANGDGSLDVLVNSNQGIELLLNSGSGTFSTSATFQLSTGSNVESLVVGDFNNDGIEDIFAFNAPGGISRAAILLGDGAGSYTEAGTISISIGSLGTQDLAVGDLNNDGNLDVFFSYDQNDAARYSAFLGGGDGTLSTTITYAGSADGESAPGSVQLGDVNGDGVLDALIGVFDEATGNINVALGNGDGTFAAAVSYTTSADPRDFRVADVNGDSILDIVVNQAGAAIAVLDGNGDGTFQAGVSQSLPVGSGGSNQDIELGDLNGDGVLDVAVAGYSGGNGTVSVLTGESSDGINDILDFSLKNVADARQAINLFQNKLDVLTEQRGEIGAFQARLEIATNTLRSTTENYAAAESRIRDADTAAETANLTRLNILRQAASAVLAQANQQPALALLLLS